MNRRAFIIEMEGLLSKWLVWRRHLHMIFQRPSKNGDRQ